MKLHYNAEDEATIQGDTVAYARSRGCLAYKFRSTSQRSVPDYLFIYKGVTFYIEFKSKDKKPSPAQNRQIKKLRDAGSRVDWTDNVTMGVAIINTNILDIDDGLL